MPHVAMLPRFVTCRTEADNVELCGICYMAQGSPSLLRQFPTLQSRRVVASWTYRCPGERKGMSSSIQKVLIDEVISPRVLRH